MRLSCNLLNVDAVDVDAEKLRAHAYASMPASYIANYIYYANINFYYQAASLKCLAATNNQKTIFLVSIINNITVSNNQ